MTPCAAVLAPCRRRQVAGSSLVALRTRNRPPARRDRCCRGWLSETMLVMSELDDPLRLAQFRSAILRLDNDGVLDECVRAAAAEAQAPIALVTFVMSKIQLFRAAVGLPPELEASRATSRCDSFCQFVVKSEAPFTVTDAQNDERVPK